MALFRAIEKPEADLGDWETYGLDPDTKKPVDFQIRAIPPVNLLAMEKAAGVAKRNITVLRKKGEGAGQMVNVSIEVETKLNIAKAVYATTNSRGFELTPCDNEAAVLWGEALQVQLEVGKPTPVDGKLTPAVRQLLFERYPELATWAANVSDKRRVRAQQEEDESKGD